MFFFLLSSLSPITPDTFADTCLLLKMWSSKRCRSFRRDQINGFHLTVLLAHLMETRVVHAHGTPRQMFTTVINWVGGGFFLFSSPCLVSKSGYSESWCSPFVFFLLSSFLSSFSLISSRNHSQIARNDFGKEGLAVRCLSGHLSDDEETGATERDLSLFAQSHDVTMLDVGTHLNVMAGVSSNAYQEMRRDAEKTSWVVLSFSFLSFFPLSLSLSVHFFFLFPFISLFLLLPSFLPSSLPLFTTDDG